MNEGTLLQEVERLRRALKFYADPQNYDDDGVVYERAFHDGTGLSTRIPDDGSLARRVLGVGEP